MAIKVLVVDDSLVFRETLSRLIDAESGIEVKFSSFGMGRDNSEDIM